MDLLGNHRRDRELAILARQVIELKAANRKLRDELGELRTELQRQLQEHTTATNERFVSLRSDMEHRASQPRMTRAEAARMLHIPIAAFDEIDTDRMGMQFREEGQRR